MRGRKGQLRQQPAAAAKRSMFSRVHAAFSRRTIQRPVTPAALPSLFGEEEEGGGGGGGGGRRWGGGGDEGETRNNPNTKNKKSKSGSGKTGKSNSRANFDMWPPHFHCVCPPVMMRGVDPEESPACQN